MGFPWRNVDRNQSCRWSLSAEVLVFFSQRERENKSQISAYDIVFPILLSKHLGLSVSMIQFSNENESVGQTTIAFGQLCNFPISLLFRFVAIIGQEDIWQIAIAFRESFSGKENYGKLSPHVAESVNPADGAGILSSQLTQSNELSPKFTKNRKNHFQNLTDVQSGETGVRVKSN